jgi:hypothetical protein
LICIASRTPRQAHSHRYSSVSSKSESGRSDTFARLDEMSGILQHARTDV